MSAWASDEAVVNLARSAAADDATVGAMRLSSRGGNWGGKDAIASKDTGGGQGAPAGDGVLFPEVRETAAATPPPAENEEDSDDICKTLLVNVCRGKACIK